jgi:hypothetical protein
MASYTDAITKFNPYVAQLPVEAMAKVSMQKQALYDEGIQKIQSQIDNVAGLDIIRDVDKNYLQSKLNELGGKLKTVAAGDFSNFQLVNSVSGMANQIVKDKDVQTAVGSTAWYRKQAAEMEAAIKEGKSSQANMHDFNEKANEYISSTDLGRSFNGRYTQYIDENKKWMDIVKTLHPNLKEYDFAYEKNADGSPNYAKVASAVQRLTNEKVSSVQIENAIRASLNPDDLNQIAINGRYQFRGYDTPEKMQVYSTTRFGVMQKNIDDRIVKLNEYANLNRSNADVYNNTISTINSLKEKKISLDANLKEELQSIAQNPNDAKALIYKNGAIDEFANAFAWETDKVNVLGNAVLDAQHWEKTYKLQQEKQNLDVASLTFDKWYKTQTLGISKAELQLKIDKQNAELGLGNSQFTTYGGESTYIKDPVIAMKLDKNAAETSATNDLTTMAKGLANGNIAATEEALGKYANGDKSAIDIRWREVADGIIANRTKAANIDLTIKNVEKEIDASPTMQAGRKDILNTISTIPGLNVTDASGKKLNFTSEEIYNYRRKEKMVGSGGQGSFLDVDYESLNNKEKLLYNKLKSTRYGSSNLLQSANSEQKLIQDLFNRFNIVSDKQKTFEEGRDAAIQSALLERTGKYIPQITTINLGKDEGGMARGVWENIADKVLMRFSSKNLAGATLGGAEKLASEDAAKARGWFAGDKKGSIKFGKLVQGDNTYLVMSLGSEEVTIPLEQHEVAQLPLQTNEPSFYTKEIRNLQQMSGVGSTNLTNDPLQSHFKMHDFPKVKDLSVTGDLRWNHTNKSLNYITLNLKLPSGWQSIQINDNPMLVSKATGQMATFTDNDVKQLFLKYSKDEAVRNEVRNLK